MPPSNSRSKTSPESQAEPGRFAPALSVDVEEWFHNCWVPEYVDPPRRPPLPRELDRLLPQMTAELAAYGAKATFFVLGELATELGPFLRELTSEGHEVACHGLHHFRVNDLAPADFAHQIRDAKARLEDVTGARVRGFRAPEWSLREPSNPRLRIVAEAGFDYDSSLMPALGAGSRANPDRPTRYRWRGGETLLEIPPLTWAGALRLPAGGWCGRAASPRWLLSAVRSTLRRGGLPLLVVHPWELVDRPCPGLYTGFARFFHDAARTGFHESFRQLLAGCRWNTVTGVLDQSLVDATASQPSAVAATPALRDLGLPVEGMPR